jgi:hypothetical protein
MVFDVSRARKEKGQGYSKVADEVCKYALKFCDLSVQKTWEAFKVLKGKRLSGAFGSLYGVKIPENLADDMPDEKDLPYLEMLYKFVFGKQSYYDLQMTRHVEPQMNDRQSEKEELRRPSDTTGENEGVAIERGEERSVAERKRLPAYRTAPQCKRIKQHWQVPPTTRVRVKKRIKRWDGFLCVIHM